MNELVTAGKRKRHAIVIRPVTRLNNEINVTPLVDVVLVLLIIFMVVTPLLEKDIALQVADSREVVQPREVPQNQIVVQVDAKGELTINAEPVKAAAYVKQLKQLLASKPKEERVVFFLADDTANYAGFVRALDGAKGAGATVLGLTPESLNPRVPVQPTNPQP